MIGIPGIAARIFSALAREGVNIIMISQASSEHTISLVFKAGEADRAGIVFAEVEGGFGGGECRLGLRLDRHAGPCS